MYPLFLYEEIDSQDEESTSAARDADIDDSTSSSSSPSYSTYIEYKDLSHPLPFVWFDFDLYMLLSLWYHRSSTLFISFTLFSSFHYLFTPSLFLYLFLWL